MHKSGVANKMTRADKLKIEALKQNIEKQKLISKGFAEQARQRSQARDESASEAFNKAYPISHDLAIKRQHEAYDYWRGFIDEAKNGAKRAEEKARALEAELYVVDADYRLKVQEEKYKNLISRLRSSKTFEDYEELEQEFGTMAIDGFEDTAQLAEECHNKATALQKQKQEQKREIEEKQKKAEDERKKAEIKQKEEESARKSVEKLYELEEELHELKEVQQSLEKKHQKLEEKQRDLKQSKEWIEQGLCGNCGNKLNFLKQCRSKICSKKSVKKGVTLKELENELDYTRTSLNTVKETLIYMPEKLDDVTSAIKIVKSRIAGPSVSKSSDAVIMDLMAKANEIVNKIYKEQQKPSDNDSSFATNSYLKYQLLDINSKD